MLTQLRKLLQSDVGLAAPMLKHLVGDVVIESRIVEGEAAPQMFARSLLNALPSLAAIGGGHSADSDDGPRNLWGYLGEDLDSKAGAMPGSSIEIVVPLKRPRGKEDVAKKIGRTTGAKMMGRDPVDRGTRIHGRGGYAGRPVGDRMID